VRWSSADGIIPILVLRKAIVLIVPTARIVVVVALSFTLVPAVSWALQVVVPKHLTSVAGNAQMGNPLACIGAAGERFQQVYQDFEVGSGTITAIAFRREDTLIFPDNAPITIPDVTITLSSTTAGPDRLNTAFETNVGDDVVTVFSGTVTSFSQVRGPGLRPFDTVVQLTTPFTFVANGRKNLLLDITVASCPMGALISFDAANSVLPDPPDSVSIVRGNASSSTGGAFTLGLVTQFTLTPPPPPVVVAAVLPGSRSVAVREPATAFAAMIAAGFGSATGCSIAPSNAPAGTGFLYQRTDPSTNVPIGQPNVPVDIPVGFAINFILVLTPTTLFDATAIEFAFDCANTLPVDVLPGVNTLLLASTSTPGPDIVALGATLSNDGIVNIQGQAGTGVFAVASVNVGASATITATADTGGASLPVAITLCQTNPSTGHCINPLSPGLSATVQINRNDTPTFSVFIQSNGDVPFLPGVNRVFVRFKTAGGATVGATSAALNTQ